MKWINCSQPIGWNQKRKKEKVRKTEIQSKITSKRSTKEYLRLPTNESVTSSSISYSIQTNLIEHQIPSNVHGNLLNASRKAIDRDWRENREPHKNQITWPCFSSRREQPWEKFTNRERNKQNLKHQNEEASSSSFLFRCSPSFHSHLSIVRDGVDRTPDTGWVPLEELPSPFRATRRFPMDGLRSQHDVKRDTRDRSLCKRFTRTTGDGGSSLGESLAATVSP